jgi:hypothetical protein
VREILGDLVVATVELAEAPRPNDFAGWYAIAERWLRLASVTAAAGITGDDSELVAQLREAAPPLAGAIRAACELDMSRTPWEAACVTRSGLEALRDLGLQLDTSGLETLLVRHGTKAHERVVAPEGTPGYHWWWYGSAPPYQRTLQMNDRMKSHLPIIIPSVSSDFRDMIARGFVLEDGCVFFEKPAIPSNPPSTPTDLEATRNAIRVEKYLPRDPSRRPVDLAGAALACGRHLAFELRRHPIGMCRIIVTVRQLTSTLRFHQVRPAQAWLTRPLERYEEALLTMDSA